MWSMLCEVMIWHIRNISTTIMSGLLPIPLLLSTFVVDAYFSIIKPLGPILQAEDTSLKAC